MAPWLPWPAPGRRGAIPGPIRQQIEAFGAGDIATARGVASPAIQGLFGNRETFARIVHENDPFRRADQG
ncbi:hypothetical protein AL036_12560 [Salipiger aestuarii]|nr:DUF4864 domain-containing protein [Salipiger aestuarii]EIE50254.1 hypothetical protein C357_14941 [Citreicella sp. 357]KAA8606901.1 hypothetical protein AL036_12560 [Salipiger aestuarii]KAA8610814.1 hypothetical protein AL037_12100 [Salipiger aestuarii]KAB2541598.1 hypothetical protein AL035_11665 [Salipiger aestuarii]